MDIKQITHKLLSLIISSLVIYSFLIIFQNSSKAQCYRDANNKIVIGSIDSTPVSHGSGAPYDKDSCSEEPLNYKVKFFRVMLCTSETYVSDDDPEFSTCTDIFNQDSGKDIVISPGTKSNLFSSGSNISLPIGTFGYMTMILSSHLGIKHYETYALANGNDATIKGYGDSFSTGTVCWTVDSYTTYTGYSDDLHGQSIRTGSPSDSTTLGVECGTEAERTSNGTYTYGYEIIDNMHDDCDPSCDTEANFRPWVNSADTGLGFSAAATLLQTVGTTLATTRDNARRIGYHIAFDTPLTISQNTKTFDMSFNTSGSVSIDFDEDTQVVIVKNGADPFVVNVTAGE